MLVDEVMMPSRCIASSQTIWSIPVGMWNSARSPRLIETDASPSPPAFPLAIRAATRATATAMPARVMVTGGCAESSSAQLVYLRPKRGARVKKRRRARARARSIYRARRRKGRAHARDVGAAPLEHVLVDAVEARVRAPADEPARVRRLGRVERRGPRPPPRDRARLLGREADARAVRALLHGPAAPALVGRVIAPPRVLGVPVQRRGRGRAVVERRHEDAIRRARCT